MCFSGAGAANEDRIALGVQEGAGGELANLSFIDRRIGEGKRIDVFEDRELGSADEIADRAGLPVGAFGPDQASDESIDLIPPGKTMPVQNLKISAMAVRGWTRSEQENAA
jgi:hypothetical protein